MGRRSFTQEFKVEAVRLAVVLARHFMPDSFSNQ